MPTEQRVASATPECCHHQKRALSRQMASLSPGCASAQHRTLRRSVDGWQPRLGCSDIGGLRPPAATRDCPGGHWPEAQMPRVFSPHSLESASPASRLRARAAAAHMSGWVHGYARVRVYVYACARAFMRAWGCGEAGRAVQLVEAA